MIAFPGLLAKPAKEAGMKVPPNADEEYEKADYPHFVVFCIAQIGRPMPYPNAIWENAKVVAAIPDDEIRLVTPEGLFERGFV